MGYICKTKPDDHEELEKQRLIDVENDIINNLRQLNAATEYEHNEFIIDVIMKFKAVITYLKNRG